MNKPIEKGSIVKYTHAGESGYYRVTAKFKETVNLGSIFGSQIYHRSVLLGDVTEAHDEWYEQWSQSETYKCM